MQKRVVAAVADLNRWAQRAEAAARAGAGDDVLRAAIRRRRASQVAMRITQDCWCVYELRPERHIGHSLGVCFAHATCHRHAGNILQDAVDKLRVQLAQHEAAVNTLQGAVSAMRDKMEQARLQTPAMKVSIHSSPVSTAPRVLLDVCKPETFAWCLTTGTVGGRQGEASPARCRRPVLAERRTCKRCSGF
jgi:hypothetical protein